MQANASRLSIHLSQASATPTFRPVNHLGPPALRYTRLASSPEIPAHPRQNRPQSGEEIRLRAQLVDSGGFSLEQVPSKGLRSIPARLIPRTEVYRSE